MPRGGHQLDPVLAAYHCAALRYQGVPWDDAFTQTAAERIVAPRSRLAVDTIAMQVAADEIRATMTAAIAADRGREERAAAYEREVLTVAASFPRAQREQLTRSICGKTSSGTCASKGGWRALLGSTTVGREETATFKSVFPKHETTRFLTQTALEISAQLRELASIVLGIRVFNRRLEELSRGGTSRRPAARPGPGAGVLEPRREDARGPRGQGALGGEAVRAVPVRLVDQALQGTRGTSCWRLADENNNRVAYWSIVHTLIEDNAEGIERVDDLARRVRRVRGGSRAD